MASPGATAAPSPTAFDNASVWHNLTSWTVQHLKDSVNNVTRFAPSIEDLILAGPRMLTKLGILSFPDAVDGFGQRVIADPTSSDYFIATTTATEMLTQVSEAAANVVDVLENEDQDPAVLVSKFSSDGAKGLGSVFSYATSKWALCCVAMAIILNRTHIFAASRRRLFLRWPIRLFLRIVPIILFTYQARQLLQSIQCQTSPDFAELRWGNSSKTSDLMFAQPSSYLHGLSTVLLLGATDFDSCRAVQMVPPSNLDYSNELQGSLSLLWPLFGTLCLSHFLETVSCAVQGRQVAVETGMTLFEHSLAFAEADAAISNQLGWGIFSSGTPSNVTFQQASGASIAISRSMIMRRVNTPPEVLLVAFLSAMSHITSHVLGVFNLQSKFRLVSTGFWAMCFMGSIVVEALDFSLDSPSSMGLFKFPTVCIIGFIPHVLVFCGTVICFSIYAVALFLSALQPPDRWSAAGRQLTFRERLVLAHENMQANISLSDIRISREMDFYTALLRTGFGVITMASEAVYLNEDHDINLKNRTWLEDERLRELEALRMQWAGSGLGASRYDSIGAIGLIPIKDEQLGASSGYARERAAQKVPKTRLGEKRTRDGVGATERSSRWLLALEFMMKINKLLLRWAALLFLKALARIGVRVQPPFLLWLSRTPKQDKKDERQPASDRRSTLLARNGKSGRFYNDETADVEAEVRRRFRRHPETANLPESEIDSRLYHSWKNGELWGSVDTSGDWEPDDGDDEWDTTSMVNSVIGDNNEEQDQWIDESEYEDGDGQRTPTQASRQLSVSREPTPFDQPIAIDDLARLLRPTNPDERREAHALAAHLTSDRIMTRSQYARMQQSQRGRLLLDPRGPPSRNKLSDEEEAELLEDLIITRRSEGARERRERDANKIKNDDDARGGPQCVVCHSAPRTIIVWPCRCLSLCDECRVTLAMNNFDKCVCCRREVVSFSRIYVP
ncbi:hypothetical protein F4805DRAFT_183823 [Annulohypoxylon moriforme]|nr:hypothetical protein F4805DRAFT_183823 [Annulohypoxylon moriforme]